MGSIRKDLARITLPDRESHHSRLFVDLAENIHIHHREYRTVFSLDEYLEYVDLIVKSTDDVLTYLENNKEYEEEKYPTTIMIGGGKNQQLRQIQNSPKPNKSKYYNDTLAIELQDEYVTDEIHIHFRDFRIAMNIDQFKVVSAAFTDANLVLNDYLQKQNVNREVHSDHNMPETSPDFKIPGIAKVKVKELKSKWYKNFENEFRPNKKWIKYLLNKIQKGERINPIILSTEADGTNLIVDGHHRAFALLKAEIETMEALILPYDFEMTQSLRDAENALKKFDMQTNYSEGVSDFFKSYIAQKTNRFYRSDFKRRKLMTRPYWKILLFIKRLIFGKRRIFKSFYEAHNE